MLPSLATLAVLMLGQAGPPARQAAATQAPEPIPGKPDNYRVLRVLMERPFKLWLAERWDHRVLFMSSASDDPRHPRHRVQLDGDPGGDLDKVSIASASVTVAPVDRTDGGLVLVKLFGEAQGVQGRSIERAQYLVRRTKPIAHERSELSVACQFPGGVTIQIAERAPLALRVVSDRPGGPASRGALLYQMVDAKGSSGTPSCWVRTPAYREGEATDFEYEATRSVANMLSIKGEITSAGRARLALLQMRPRAENAEDVGQQAIDELSSFNDGGCAFEAAEGNPLPIPARLEPLFVAYDDYVTFFPDGKRAARVLYQKASWLSGCRRHREAAGLYARILERYPKDELASDAKTRRDEELKEATKQEQTAPSAPGASRAR